MTDLKTEIDSSDFEVIIASDTDYEFVVVEIEYKGQHLLTINKEDGEEDLLVEFYGEYHGNFYRDIDYNMFLKALEYARQRLLNLVP